MYKMVTVDTKNGQITNELKHTSDAVEGFLIISVNKQYFTSLFLIKNRELKLCNEIPK